jgi:hypothetical protein
LNSGHKEATNILEERLIDAEYKIWKKNTPYLYNIVATHSLEWPSLTCQWLPTTKRYGGSSSSSGPGKQKGSSASAALVEYQLLLGTHTTGDEPNYLMIATCILPPEEEEVIPSSQQTTTTTIATDDGQPTVPAAKLRYDEEQKEVGGYGLAGPDVGRIEVKMRIKHEGEVNRYVLYANLLGKTVVVACSSSRSSRLVRASNNVLLVVVWQGSVYAAKSFYSSHARTEFRIVHLGYLQASLHTG